MPNRKDVFTIVERNGQKPSWLKIGTAFVNKDESLNVYLNALPIIGEPNIRDAKPGENGEPNKES
jgi:hypothetical protein